MKLEIDDNAYWLALLTSLSICFIIFMSITLFYFHNKNKIIAKTIARNSSPIEIAIALGKDFNTSDAVMLFAEKTTNNNKGE